MGPIGVYGKLLQTEATSWNGLTATLVAWRKTLEEWDVMIQEAVH